MTASHSASPKTLDRDIEVAPGDWQAQEFYYLMTAMVIPRPIGWISTISAKGVSNVAPYSYFNMMGNDPPYVAFASTGVKDTLANLREVPQFVANIVTMHVLEEMQRQRSHAVKVIHVLFLQCHELGLAQNVGQAPQRRNLDLGQQVFGFDHFFGYNCQRHAHSYFPTYLYSDDKRFDLEGNTGKGQAGIDAGIHAGKAGDDDRQRG